MPQTKGPPVHPGAVLREEFLVPLGISQARLAKETGITPHRIQAVVRERRPINADLALRFARFFGTSERFWLNLQAHHDLEVERERLGKRLKQEVRVFARSL